MNRQHQDDDEAVLARIMADGTFDSLRHKLLDELRNDVRSAAQCIRCNRHSINPHVWRRLRAGAGALTGWRFYV